MEVLGLLLIVVVVMVLVMIIVYGASRMEPARVKSDLELVEEGDTQAIARCLEKSLEGMRIEEVRLADNGTTLCVRFRVRKLEIADRRYGLKSRLQFQAYQHEKDAVGVVYAGLDLVRGVTIVIASGYDELIDDKGWPYLGCVITVKASREVARSLNRSNLLPIQVLSHFEYRTNVERTTGSIGTVEPLDTDGETHGPLSARDQEITRLFASLKAAENPGTVEEAKICLKQGLEDFISMMRHELSNRRIEYLVIGFFNQDKNLIAWQEIRGHSIWVTVSSAATVQLALAKGAASIAEVHNHPNLGSPQPLLEPSDADFESSYALWKACKGHGIEFLGAYIVSKREVHEYFFSTCQRLNISLEDSPVARESAVEGNAP